MHRVIFQHVYRYRWLIYELVLRDVRLRYRGSVLGQAWSLMNPLLFAAIYTLVFTAFLHVDIAHYPVYLLSGLLPWTWLSGALQQSVTSLVDGRMYVGKTLFPVEILVLVPVLAHGWNFICSLPVLFVLAFFFHVHLGWSLLALPALIFIELLVVYALSLLVASFYVFYRDVQQLTGYAITAMFFMTPLFYTMRSVPASLSFLVSDNPLAAIIGAYQDAIYRDTPPSLDALLFAAFFALVASAVASGVFSRCHESFGEFV
jgi:ABC-type polysaccharide/polyol phosphate export permease